MKICFMGTPQFAANILQVLLNANHNITAVYTRPPRQKARGRKITNSPVHNLALAHNVPVFYPQNFKDPDDTKEFIEQNFDLVLVAAYGLILPTSILNTPKFGCINIHTSLLPRWRGAAPIERSIEAGDLETGVTLMYMAKGLDTGDIISSKKISITPTTTAGELYQQLELMGIDLLFTVLKKLKNGNSLPRTPQDNTNATYAPMLNKAEGKMDFNQPAEIVERKIRAFEIFPGSYFFYKNEMFKVKSAKVINIPAMQPGGTIINSQEQLHIATRDKILSVSVIQRQGKIAMPIKELLKGFSFKVGDVIQ